MPRGTRPKPCTNLVSEEIYKEIKSIRPLRLFINKQKRKGNLDNPFSLRVKFCQLPKEKQARYLQRSVDRYIELLDEKDVDEQVQVECKLFDYLLIRSEQKKYFESINAPTRPPGTAVPFFTQLIKQDNIDDNEPTWKSLSITEQQSYKDMRKEAKAEYAARVRNFANDLPDRLRIDYLLFAEYSPYKRQVNNILHIHDYNDTNALRTICQRRKSLTALPESLQTMTTTPDIQHKLTKLQLQALHQCMPSVVYYETAISDDNKPTFTKTMTKNAYMRSTFNQLHEQEKIPYILNSIKKWNEFLNSNPNIVANQIPTLHLLLGKNEDVILYFSSIGLPPRPPTNSYLLFNHEKEGTGSQQLWSSLSQTERHQYSQQLAELKNDYYQKLVDFVDNILASDYIRYEFFRNVKYAIKDYEFATKLDICDKNTGQLKIAECFMRKMSVNNDLYHFHQIKQRLLSTGLTNQQIHLVEELNQLLEKYLR